MNESVYSAQRRFYRRSDKAMLGGVCAGLADYFGFNLRATRLLALIAFLVATPFALLSYLGIALLVPARPAPQNSAPDAAFRRSVRYSPSQAASDIRARFQALDRRLAQLEKYVTSSRYQLDREFRNL